MQPNLKHHVLESAEIFVVCQYYIAPDKLDPKFLDPKYVFSELDIEPTNKLNVYNPVKTKHAAEGYQENDYTLYHTLSVKDFIAHENAVEALQTVSAIIFLYFEYFILSVKFSCYYFSSFTVVLILTRKIIRGLRKILVLLKLLYHYSNEKKRKKVAT